jgi:putative endonuclease
MREFAYVYILASGFKHLYIGVTSDIEQRIFDHKNGKFPGSFTDRYNINQLVYLEQYGDIRTAIAREKQLKRWSRIKKIRLIVAMNPDWKEFERGMGKADRAVPRTAAVTRALLKYRDLSTTAAKSAASGRDDNI